MQSFFSRLLHPPRARGPTQAPPARGQAQVNALLSPYALGSEDLDDFVHVIQASDPQNRRVRGIIGRARPSRATTSPASPSQGINVTYPFIPETESMERNIEPANITGHVSDSGSSWALSPPASLLIEKAASTESFVELSPPASLLVEGAARNGSPGNTKNSPEGGSACSSYATSYSHSPGSDGSYHPVQWDLLQNLVAVIEDGEFDSDASTLIDSMYASSVYDDDAPEIDIDDLEVSLTSSHHNSIRGNAGDPEAESSISQVPGDEGD